MEFLLELKENIRRIYNRFDKIIVPVIRFFIALVSFLMLNSNIGYMAKIKNPLIAIILSIACAFLPSWFTILVLSIFMILHLYAISIEFTIVALCVILVMYLMFFRFSSKYGYLLIATVLLCWMKIPAAIPVVAALGFGMVTIVPVAFGVIIFSIIETASQYEAAIQSAYPRGTAHGTPYSPSEGRKIRPDVRMPPRSGDSSGSRSPHPHYKGTPERTSATRLFLRYSSIPRQDCRNPTYSPDLRRSRSRDIRSLSILQGPQSFPSSFLPYCLFLTFFFSSLFTTADRNPLSRILSAAS